MKNRIKLLLIILLCFMLCGCDLFKSDPKVTFNYNCEGLNNYKCQTIDNKLNCMFILPECGEKEFVGWYDAKTSGQEINLDADFTDDIIIYARWKEKGEENIETIVPDSATVPPIIESEPEPEPEVIVSYKVNFNANGGKGGQNTSIDVKYSERMPAISKTIPVRDGYTFIGWFDSKNYIKGEAYYNELCESTKYYDKKSNITLYAGWKENSVVIAPTPTAEKYVIKFNANGGKGGPSSLEAKYDEVLPQIKTSKPTRSGYTFIGWFDNTNYIKGTEYYSDNQTSSMKYNRKSNITLYAGWKINKYTISFDLNGGTSGGFENKEVEYNSLVPTISKTVPTKSDYIFTGWYDNKDYTKGKAYYNDRNEPAKYYDRTSNVILYAGWSKIIIVQKYKITFNINGGNGITPSIEEIEVGSSLPKINSPVPTRMGYIFKGWYDNANYSKGVQYYNYENNATRSYDKRTDTVLYAGWESQKYAITFNINGGYGETPKNVNANYNQAMPRILTDFPTKKGYVFMGWYDNSDYTKGTKYYTDRNISATNYNKTSSSTLYAGWRQVDYLTGSTLTNFKNSNNINSSSSIVISKHPGKINNISVNMYYVYNKNNFSESDYNSFIKYSEHVLAYAGRVDSKIINLLVKNGFEIIFMGNYECDNGSRPYKEFIFAAYCNSNNRKITVAFSPNNLNDSYYEGSIIHEMGHDYDITLRYLLAKEKQVGLTGLTAQQITNGFTSKANVKVSASTLNPLFYFNDNGSPYTWSYLAKNYAVPLKQALYDFSTYSDNDLSNSGLEFYAETFSAYFWDSEHRQKLKQASPITYNAMEKMLSYVK